MSVYMVVDIRSVCRFCLSSSETLTNIFDEHDEEGSLTQKVLQLVGIQIEDEEELPNKTCEECRSQICNFYNFKNIVIQSHNTLSKKVMLLKHVEVEVNLSENNELIVREDDFEPVKEDLCTKTKCDEQESKSTTKWLHKEYPTITEAIRNNRCLLCLKEFTGKEILKAHVNEHIAGTEFDSYYVVNDRDIYCRHCSQYFEYRYNYIDHQRVELNMKPYACGHDGCTLSFYSRSMLMQHLPKHGVRRFFCVVCGQSFKRKCEVRAHEFIHSDEGQPYSCDKCHKQFKNRITLKAHIRMHLRSPKHKCPKCVKEYHSRSELKRHMFSHSKVKLFSCTICTSSYYSKSALARHLRETCDVGAKDVGGHACKWCKMIFANLTDMSRHIETDHISESLEDPSTYSFVVKPTTAGIEVL